MKMYRALVPASGLILVMLAASAWAYWRLGDQPVPVHWGLTGQPNEFAGAGAALLIIPGLSVAISLLLAVMPRLMPRRQTLERSALAYEVRWIGAIAVLLVVHVAMIAKAAGASFDILHPITLGIAAFMLVLGNYMGKIRYNYLFGFRTPWTLSDERVWDKTHRVLGRCTVASALLLLGLVFMEANGPDGDRLLAFSIAGCALSPVLVALGFSIVASQRTNADPHSA